MRVWTGTILLLAAACAGKDDASYWVKRLDDPETEVEAVQNLQRIGDATALEPLGKLFARKRHPDILRAMAGFSGKPGFDRAKAVEIFVSALDFTEDEYNNATVAAEALADLDAKEAVDALVQVLDKPLNVRSRANLAKAAAVQALTKLGDPRAVDGLVRAMERPPEEQDFMLAKKAAEALGLIGDPRAVKPLVKGLFRASTRHTPMFIEAHIALVRLGTPSVQPLIDAYQGKDLEINAMATKLQFVAGIVAHKSALVLGELKAAESVEALKAGLKAKQEGDNHRGTIFALGMIGTPETLDPLLWAAEKHPDWNMRVSACEALNLHGSAGALATLLRIAKSGYILVEGEKYNEARWAAAMAYARMAGGDGYQQLKPIVEAATPEEGRSIFDEALQRLEVARDCKDDAACYAKALDDPVLAKQESAAFHLARLADGRSQLPAVVKKLQTKEPVVRLAVLYAMDRLADKSCAPCIEGLAAQIDKDKGKTINALGGDLVTSMRLTLARISRS